MNVTAQKKSNLRATQKSILIAICLIDRSRETILKKSCCVYIKMRDRSAVFEYLPTYRYRVLSPMKFSHFAIVE